MRTGRIMTAACKADRKNSFYFNERLRKVKNCETPESVAFDFNDGLRLMNHTARGLIVHARGNGGTERELWFVEPGRAAQSRSSGFVRWDFDVADAVSGQRLFQYRWCIAGLPVLFRFEAEEPAEFQLQLDAAMVWCRREGCDARFAGPDRCAAFYASAVADGRWCDAPERLFPAAGWFLGKRQRRG